MAKCENDQLNHHPKPPLMPPPPKKKALDSPKDLTVAEVTETTMMLKWKRPVAKLDSFRMVHVSADGHKAEEVVPGGSESHSLRGLTPGMLYTISITAERGSRTSAPTTISAPTGQCNKSLLLLCHVLTVRTKACLRLSVSEMSLRECKIKLEAFSEKISGGLQ